MTKLLLTIHVLAAIVAIGPVTVAASMFPAATRRADLPTLRTLHRICTVYAALGVVVPVFGLATATSLGVLGDAWLLVSIGLTLLAAAVLALLVLPRQAAVLTTLAGEPGPPAPPAEPSDHPQSGHASTATVAGSRASLGAQASRLGMVTGVFNLLWAVVVVLMIVRPGSTTGA